MIDCTSSFLVPLLRLRNNFQVLRVWLYVVRVHKGVICAWKHSNPIPALALFCPLDPLYQGDGCVPEPLLKRRCSFNAALQNGPCYQSSGIQLEVQRHPRNAVECILFSMSGYGSTEVERTILDVSG